MVLASKMPASDLPNPPASLPPPPKKKNPRVRNTGLFQHHGGKGKTLVLHSKLASNLSSYCLSLLSAEMTDKHHRSRPLVSIFNVSASNHTCVSSLCLPSSYLSPSHLPSLLKQVGLSLSTGDWPLSQTKRENSVAALVRQGK